MSSRETAFPHEDAVLASGDDVAHGSPPSTQPSAALPPGMASFRQHSVDEVITLLNRTPLFMTTLDETDGAGGENVELEALRALAYEGTRAEVAANFKEQGNELARERRWSDAREYYGKAIAALRSPRRVAAGQAGGEGETEIEVVKVDEEAEGRRESELEEACLVNRALCNLVTKNYRACVLDCAATLRLNPRNVKAYYRSASACLSLDKIPEATDACSIGLTIEPTNGPLTALAANISRREAILDRSEKVRRERQERTAAEQRTLRTALSARNVKLRYSATGGADSAPELEDAKMHLADPSNATSSLRFPVLLLYPTHAQSDFIKAVGEGESLGAHLAYIFPLPWDNRGEYKVQDVECYMEDAQRRLLKVGKKLTLLELLGGGTVEVMDGIVRVMVVPAARARDWVETWKRSKKSG